MFVSLVYMSRDNDTEHAVVFVENELKIFYLFRIDVIFSTLSFCLCLFFSLFYDQNNGNYSFLCVTNRVFVD